MRLKSVGVVSCGVVLGCIYAVVGLIVGGLFSLVSFMGLALNRAQPDMIQGQFPGRGIGGAEVGAGILFGTCAIIAAPVIYGIMGFVGGMLIAGFYNLIASVVGGIEVEFTDVQPVMAPRELPPG